jgi:predicted  nucleic acid-binding Zn-ribbon protein
MSNLEKWCNAILQEDADKMSMGSVRTIQMIKHEFERLQRENQSQSLQIKQLREENERLKKGLVKAEAAMRGCYMTYEADQLQSLLNTSTKEDDKQNT